MYVGFTCAEGKKSEKLPKKFNFNDDHKAVMWNVAEYVSGDFRLVKFGFR